MFHADNWAHTKARHAAFWAGTLEDGCLVSAFAPTAPNHGLPSYTKAERARRRQSPEDMLLDARTRFAHTHFAGDAFACLMLDFGAAGHAAFFPDARYTVEDTVWFFPSIADTRRPLPPHDANAPLYRLTVEAARYLARESRGEFVVSMPDTAGNLDALAHLRGSAELMMDLVDDPDWVQASLRTIQDSWAAVNEEVFAHVLPANDGGSAVGWLYTWAPGRHAQLQVDLAAMISKAQFDAFALPDLDRQAGCLDHALYHFDGQEQIRHLDSLLSLDSIKAIQWTNVAGQPPARAFVREMQRIQAAGKRLLVLVHDRQDIEALIGGLVPEMLYLVIHADTPQDADDAVRLVQTLSRERRRELRG